MRKQYLSIIHIFYFQQQQQHQTLSIRFDGEMSMNRSDRDIMRHLKKKMVKVYTNNNNITCIVEHLSNKDKQIFFYLILKRINFDV